MSLESILSMMTLGESSGVLHFESPGDCMAAVDSLTRQARKDIKILTPDLEPVIYNRREFIDNLLQFIRISKFSRLRILVKDIDATVKQGHLLVELYRRFSSYIEIRRLADDYRDIREAFFIVDETGMVYRKHDNLMKGSIDFNAIPLAPQKSRFFVEAWERSRIDPNFRQLNI